MSTHHSPRITHHAPHITQHTALSTQHSALSTQHSALSTHQRSCPMDIATIDELLTTTRSVRKRMDLTRPVEPEIIERCIEIAIQAPSGSNQQGWHFIVVTDPELRAGLSDLYRQSFNRYVSRGPVNG